MVALQRVLTSTQLPTLPTVALRLLELTQKPETEIHQVIEAVKADPAISAKLVKAANSSLFGQRTGIKSVDRAVPLIGTTVTTSMALSFSLVDAAFAKGPLRDYYQAYWQQSIVHAVAAELLAKRFAPNQLGEYFLSGLLMDLGRLAMLKTIGSDYAPVLESAVDCDRPLHVREQELLGFTHVDVGVKLMEQWKLPAEMIAAVQQHHGPVDQLILAPEQRLVLSLAAAASVGDYFCTTCQGTALHRLQLLTRHGLQLPGDELDLYLKQCELRIREAGDLFDVDFSTLGSSSDLMLQANEQLADLALKVHVANTQATVRHELAEREKQNLEIQNRNLQQRALHDPLTGIYNRAFFDESVQREVFRCQREAAPIAAVFVDIDHFKTVNDTYGHAAGDDMLKTVAKTLQYATRNSDILARYGGEEFVVLVHQPAEKGLQRLAERLREAVAATPCQYGEVNISVTCSVGSSIAIPGRKDRDIGARLLAAADECLYEAKRQGRNRCVFRSLVSDADQALQQMVAAQRFSRWLVNEKLLDVASVSRALIDCPPQNSRIGELGISAGLLTETQVNTVLAEQESSGERFGEVAVRQGWLTQTQLAQLLALQHENPKRLAAGIMKLGLLSPDQAAAALERYTQQFVPQAAVLA